jgi:hypothetical protein
MARTTATTSRTARQATANTRRNRYVALAARVARHQPPVPTLTRKPPATTPATTPAATPAATPVESVTAPEPVGASPEHQTTVTGAGEQWHASCSCGEWRTANPYKRESGAKGAATKHRNTAEAARLG